MRIWCSLSLCFALATLMFGQSRKLEIYWIDVEGGAATLVVAPSGQALLVDAGFAGNDDRDARRVMETIKAAHVSKIDFLITTHFHGDHVGGVPALAKLIPIERFYDHGDSIQIGTPERAALFEAYKSVSHGKRVVVKPGDKIPLDGLDMTVVSANGEVIPTALNGGTANALCKGAQQKDPDETENSRSVGFLLTYGKFKFLDLGDLTWDRELMLACPTNKVGTVTLFQATHHGFSNGASGSPAMVWAAKPQVVIVNNGPRKGFDATAYETLSKIPGVEGIWQMHRSLVSDAAHNTSESMISNLDEGKADQFKSIKVSASKDGTFTVVNSRNNFSKSYRAR